MADQPKKFNFFTDDSDEKKGKPDYGYSAYSWSPYQWAAYTQGVRMDPMFTTAAEKRRQVESVSGYWDNVYEDEPVRQRTPVNPFPEEFQNLQREMTPGEKIAKLIGEANQYNVLHPGYWLTAMAGKPEQDDSPTVQWLKDFSRAAGTSFAQTGASTIGSITDLFTGNLDKNQNYDIAGNQQKDYANYGGSAQFLGSLADDVAIAAATWGTGNALLAGMKGAPSAITLFGRVIAPSATLGQRLAGAAAGAVPAAISALPEVISGRTSVPEAGADVGLGAVGGGLTAGLWGGGRLANIASDVAVNTATGAIQGLTPLIPGGREFNSDAYLQSLAYGTALGTVFGVMGSAPNPTVNRNVRFGARYSPEAAAGPNFQASAEAATDAGSFTAPIFREAEMAVYGKSDIPEAATTTQAMQASVARGINEVQSIKRNVDGTISSISETKTQTNAFPEGMSTAAAQQAAHLERVAYANALVKSSNPDALIQLLDLNRPAGSPPETVAQAIIDEVLVQPGKGINEVERRLAAANLDSPIPRGEAGPAPTAETIPAADIVAQQAQAAEAAAAAPAGGLFNRGNVPVADPRYNILPVPPEIRNRPSAAVPVQPPPLRSTSAASEATLAPETAPIAGIEEAQALPVAEFAAPETVLTPEQQVAKAELDDDGASILEKVSSNLAATSTSEPSKIKKSRINRKVAANAAAPAKKAAEAIAAVTDEISAKDQLGSRQNKRTAQKQIDQVADFFREGEVDLGQALSEKYKGGGQRSVAQKTILQMVGLPMNTIKRMVDEGVEYFADGTVRVRREGDNYFATWNGAKGMDTETKASELLQAFDAANLQNVPPRVKELANRASDIDKSVAIAKQINRDVQEVFSFVDEYLKPEPSYASIPEALESFKKTSDKIGVSDLTIDDSGLATGYERWLRETGVMMRQSSKEVKSAIDKIDASPSTPPSQRLGVDSTGQEVTAQIISRHLMSRYGPEGFRAVSQKWLEVNTTPEMRSHLESPQFTRFENKDPRFLNAIQSLIDSYSNYSDDAMLAAFRKVAGRIEDADNGAKYLADKLGIDDPEKIKNIYEKQSALPLEEQIDITERISKLIEDDPEAIDATNKLSTYAQYNIGRDDWVGIDQTLQESSKKYNWKLRDLPLTGIMSAGASIYIMNEVVDKFEDDETYFGVPGRTLKRLFGSGNAGYVVAGMVGIPGMRGMHKSAAKPGTKFGSIMATLDAKRQVAIDNLRNLPGLGRYSLPDTMTPEQFRTEAELIVNKNFADANGNKYVPGSPEHESMIQYVMAIHRDSRTMSARVLGEVIGNKGTIDDLQMRTFDYSQMIERNAFFREHINDKRNEAELAARNIEAGIIGKFNEVWSEVRSRALKNKDARIVDAFVENDALQTDINLASSSMSPEAVVAARAMVNKKIVDKYFTVNGKLDEQAYTDYQRVQAAADDIRAANYGSLIGLSEGVPWYEARSKVVKLENDLSTVRATFGSIEKGLKEKEATYEQARKEYDAVFKQGGKEAAQAAFPEYKEQASYLKHAIREDKSKLRSLASDITSIEKSISNLNSIDDGIKRSQESGYMVRHRNGNAAFVLRLEYDERSGLIGERREFTNEREARVAEQAYAKRAVAARRPAEVTKLQNQIDEYERLVEETLISGEKIDPKIEAEAQKAYVKRAELAGYKPIEEMTELQLRQELEAYGVSLQVYDNKNRKVRASSSAAKAVMSALLSANQLRGAISVARSIEGFIPSKKNNPNGNESLVNNKTGDVIMYSGEDAPTIESLIDEMENMVDGAIDRAQLKQFLENNLTYRDKGKGPKGETQETIWIDMVGLRAIASRYLEPSIPNLARRNNIQGYYNPDGDWTPKDKWNWAAKSFEMMQGQIASNTQRTIMRPIVADAIQTLRRAEVRNGLVEYLTQFESSASREIVDPTSKLGPLFDGLTRIQAIGTLAVSVGSAIANRGFGIYNAMADFSMQVRTRYGLQRANADGTLGSIEWFTDKGQADYEFLKRLDEGQTGWMKVEGYTPRQFDPTSYAIAFFSIFAPKQTFQVAAKFSPYYKSMYDAVVKANIKEGTIVGNYALKGGVPTGSLQEKSVIWATRLMSSVEQQNNWTSALLATESARIRLGLTDTDWLTLTRGGRTDVIDRITYAYKTRIQEDAKVASKLQGEIDVLQSRLDAEADPNMQASIRRELLIKQAALDEQVMTEEKATTQIIMKNIIGDRRFQQGGWSSEDMTQIERNIKSVAALRPFMVFTAPVLRQAGASTGLFYRALRTSGVKADKLRRYRGVLAGAGIMLATFGVYAVPAMITPWAAVGDVANAIEFIVDLFQNDEDDKLNQMNGRKFWENAGGDMVESIGGDRKTGENTVRALWTDGWIKYTWDINVGGGGGVFEGTRMPFSGLMISAAKNLQRTIGDFSKAEDAGARAYLSTNILPPSGKKIIQGGIQLYRGQKLDRFGNPIEDPLNPEGPGKSKPFGVYDAMRHVLFGKKWSEVRSALESYEGGTPVLTPEDRVAFARQFANLPYLKFSGLGKEQSTAALFERDAADLQRLTSAIYREKYRSAADIAKENFSKWVESGQAEMSPDGPITPKEMMLMVGASGNMAEFELRGSGFEKARSLAYGYADRYAYSMAAAEATNAIYGKTVGVSSSDEDFKESSGAFEFMMAKFANAVRNSYKAGMQRRKGRAAIR